MKTTYDLIYSVVEQVPRGSVATYGQIAELAGISRQPRRIGYALSMLPPGSGIPWHRVINAKGEVSARSEAGADNIQRKLLEREGIIFNRAGRVDLERFRWRPPY